jgi:DNA-binding winged helix-turn-helix (wHTH) protein/tetratricopeptide (TPR) repeat protein
MGSNERKPIFLRIGPAVREEALSTASAPLIYRIGDIEVDVAGGVFSRARVGVHLKPKAFAVLLHLIANRDRLVPKEELMELFWNNAAVTDDVLTQSIGELRRAFEDDARSPVYVKTVPRRGYRFLAEVEELRATALIAREEITTVEIAETYTDEAPPVNKRYVWLAAAALLLAGGAWLALGRRGPGPLPPTPGKRQVVVLPFDNRSGQADLDWLRSGLPDMLTATLTRSPSVDVLSREQAALWLGRIGQTGLPAAIEVARRGHAHIAVTGAFARLGDAIRVDAQIYDGSTGALLGADSITAPPAQILSRVDELGARLAVRLRPASRDDDRRHLASLMTDNLEAYRDYELGLREVDAIQERDGIRLLERAIALDPNFAMAYARLGYAYAIEGRTMEAGRPYLEKAFRMGDRLTAKDRQHVLAWYALANADYQEAIHRYSELIAAYPNEIEAYLRLAVLLRGESRHEEGIAVIQQALAIDPEDPRLYNSLASLQSESGRHGQALDAARQYVRLAPADPNAYDSLALALEYAGQSQEAFEALSRSLEVKPDFEVAWIHRVQFYWRVGRIRDSLRLARERLAAAGVSQFDRGRYWDLIAWIDWRRGETAGARKAVDEARRFFGNDGLLANPAVLLSDAGGRVALTSGHGARFGLRSYYFYRAQESRRQKDSAAMLENLRTAVRYAPSWGTMEILEDGLGDGFLELGKVDDAIAEYRRGVAHLPGLAATPVPPRQGLAAQGRRDESRAEYRQFLETWKDADRDLPELAEARRAG